MKNIVAYMPSAIRNLACIYLKLKKPMRFALSQCELFQFLSEIRAEGKSDFYCQA